MKHDYRAYSIMENTDNALYSMDEIATLVCEEFKVDKAKMLGKKRHNELVTARQVAQFCCFYYRQDWTLQDVGSYFDRNHSTVLFSIKTVRDLCSVEPIFEQKILRIINTIGFDVESLNYDYMMQKTYFRMIKKNYPVD